MSTDLVKQVVSQNKEVGASIGALEKVTDGIFRTGGSMSPIIKKITLRAMAEVHDVTTRQGRMKIASAAASVSTDKATIERVRKAFTDSIRGMIEPSIAEGKRVAKELSDLRDLIRQPLTDWEADEKAAKLKKVADDKAEALRLRVEDDHEMAILMNDIFNRDKIADENAKKLQAIEEAEQAEERRKKAAEELKERDAKIATEAAANAVKEEKRKAEARIAKLKADKEKSIADVEKAKNDKILADEQNEREKIAREKQVKIDADQAAEKAKADQARAVQVEKDRQDEEIAKKERDEKAAEDARKLISDDKNHREWVRKSIKNGLMHQGVDRDLAKKVVIAIDQGLFEDLKIIY